MRRQPQHVAQPMREEQRVRVPLHQLRRRAPQHAGVDQPRRDRLRRPQVQILVLDPRPRRRDRLPLRGQHHVVQLPLHARERPPGRERPRHVRCVSAHLRSRVDQHQLPLPQFVGARITVQHRRTRPARHDRVVRRPLAPAPEELRLQLDLQAPLRHPRPRRRPRVQVPVDRRVHRRLQVRQLQRVLRPPRLRQCPRQPLRFRLVDLQLQRVPAVRPVRARPLQNVGVAQQCDPAPPPLLQPALQLRRFPHVGQPRRLRLRPGRWRRRHPDQILDRHRRREQRPPALRVEPQRRSRLRRRRQVAELPVRVEVVELVRPRYRHRQPRRDQHRPADAPPGRRRPRPPRRQMLRIRAHRPAGYAPVSCRPCRLLRTAPPRATRPRPSSNATTSDRPRTTSAPPCATS